MLPYLSLTGGTLAEAMQHLFCAAPACTTGSATAIYGMQPTAFTTAHREAVNQPIPCRSRLQHASMCKRQCEQCLLSPLRSDEQQK